MNNKFDIGFSREKFNSLVDDYVKYSAGFKPLNVIGFREYINVIGNAGAKDRGEAVVNLSLKEVEYIIDDKHFNVEQAKAIDTVVTSAAITQAKYGKGAKGVFAAMCALSSTEVMEKGSISKFQSKLWECKNTITSERDSRNACLNLILKKPYESGDLEIEFKDKNDEIAQGVRFVSESVCQHYMATEKV